MRHPLLQEYFSLNLNKTLTNEEYYSKQKDLLKKTLAELKNSPVPELDYIVGMIAVHEGDRYNIPIKNTFGHLNRAYKNGSDDAGLFLSSILNGTFTHIPEEYWNSARGVEILNEVASKGNAKGKAQLSSHYLAEIFKAIEAGVYVPDDWFNLCYKNAVEAAKLGNVGGYTMLGYLYSQGFGLIVTQNFKESFMHYHKVLDLYDGNYDDSGNYADAKHAIGAYYYDGIAVLRDRKKGLELIKDAADLGNIDAQNWLAQNQDFLMQDGLGTDNEDELYDDSFSELEEFGEIESPKETVLPSESGTKRITH